MTKRNWRDAVYSRIKLSVKTMDIIIYCIVAAIVIALILGIAL